MNNKYLANVEKNEKDNSLTQLVEQFNINIPQKQEHADKMFAEGYTCAQAVFVSMSDLFGIDSEFAKTISAPFGGGMGRLREVCGTCSAMAMLCGLKYPATDPSDIKAKTENYAAVQRCANKFKAQFGTIKCGELLRQKPENDPVPTPRTVEYYSSRPCARFIRKAIEIIGEELSN